MAKYRKKDAHALVVNAVQFNGSNAPEVAEILGPGEQLVKVDGNVLTFSTNEGDCCAFPGNYVVRRDSKDAKRSHAWVADAFEERFEQVPA